MNEYDRNIVSLLSKLFTFIIIFSLPLSDSFLCKFAGEKEGFGG